MGVTLPRFASLIAFRASAIKLAHLFRLGQMRRQAKRVCFLKRYHAKETQSRHFKGAKTGLRLDAFPGFALF
jgi:hypothetical protein